MFLPGQVPISLRRGPQHQKSGNERPKSGKIVEMVKNRGIHGHTVLVGRKLFLVAPHFQTGRNELKIGLVGDEVCMKKRTEGISIILSVSTILAVPWTRVLDWCRDPRMRGFGWPQNQVSGPRLARARHCTFSAGQTLATFLSEFPADVGEQKKNTRFL